MRQNGPERERETWRAEPASIDLDEPEWGKREGRKRTNQHEDT